MVEHRLARLVQLGIRQARYIGRTKTLFQVGLAAAVANLTLLAATSDATPVDRLWCMLSLVVALTAMLRLILGPAYDDLPHQRLFRPPPPVPTRRPAHSPATGRFSAGLLGRLDD